MQSNPELLTFSKIQDGGLPRCRCVKVKVCMPGGLQCVVLYIKFY